MSHRMSLRRDDDDDLHTTGNNSARSSHSVSESESEGEGEDGTSRRRSRRNADNAATQITHPRTVIHETLIRRALHKELRTYYDKEVVPRESELDLRSVTKLALSYCNISAIANLHTFTTLTELKLDNNIIERISGLDALVNLRSLDLSFNKIRRIEGLTALTKLRDLSLFDNEISVVENIDHLTELNVLSLGNNQIQDLEFVQGTLRQFKNLRMLNLKGNPVCAHDDYHNTIFAYLTTLRYLDYVVIEASQFAKARDAKLDQLLILEAKEKQEESASREKKAEEENQAKMDAANLAGVSTLFQDMIKADAEHPKIRVLPGFDAIFTQYKAAFQQIIDEFTGDILARHHVKVSERAICDKVLLKVTRQAEEESRAAIGAYHHKKKKVFVAYASSLDRGQPDHDALMELRQDLLIVIDKLMDIEMLLVEQVESIMTEFEKAFLKLLSENVLRINSAFRALIDASNQHLNAVYDLTHALLEKYAKDDTFTDDVDVKAILADKDVLNNAVTTSHENQEGKIAAKEDEVREREEGNGKRSLKEMRDAQRARNRKRVAEIYEFKAREEASIDEQEQQEDEEA